MLIDTHCHLNFQAFNSDFDTVVRRAIEVGVEKIVVPGTDLTSSQKAIKLAELYQGKIYAAIGIHPHHAKDKNLIVNNGLKQQLVKLANHSRVVAIGEIGLDFHVYKHSKYSNTQINEPLEIKQLQLLLIQLEVAQEKNLPVVLHCRSSYPQLIQTVSKFSRKYNYQPGVWHCFEGNAKQLQAILAMGYYIGFDGNITYSSGLEKLVASTPLERLLLETDSPYLTPLPYRGQRNEPQNIRLIAEKVAQIKATSLYQVAKQTTNNAHQLFNF